MRISTKMIYDTGTTQMNTLQAALNKTQMQLSTNRKNLTPSDDPIASARALEVTQSQSINTQLVTNRDSAKTSLSLETNALASVTDLLQDVTSLVVTAGNATYTDSDRAALATELEGRLTDLLAVANTADGSGNYLFSGYKATTQPFTPNATGATYQGDQGQRTLQVGSPRTMATSDSGSAVFESNLTGNGTFTTAADAGNVTRGGSGIISAGSVSDATKLTGHDYSIKFSTSTDALTNTTSTFYTVTDDTTGQPVPDNTPIAYKAGDSISFDGQALTITGKPADGDIFTTKPSTRESVFTTITNLLGVLRTGASGDAAQAAMTNGLNAAHTLLDTASNNVLTIQASVGSRLKELDYLDTSGSDLDIQYATTLSGLQDLDQVAAISLFTQQQTTLQAAQKSFTSMTSLSLFNYIS
jgi:flagellar hook-associated protein 3 FlgL